MKPSVKLGAEPLPEAPKGPDLRPKTRAEQRKAEERTYYTRHGLQNDCAAQVIGGAIERLRYSPATASSFDRAVLLELSDVDLARLVYDERHRARLIAERDALSIALRKAGPTFSGVQQFPPTHALEVPTDGTHDRHSEVV